MMPTTILNEERIRTTVLAEIDQYRKMAHLALQVANALERVDGKPINRRITTALMALGVTSYLKDGTLAVWSRDVPFGAGVTFTLTAHPSTGKFNHQLFMAEKFGIARYLDMQAKADDMMAALKNLPTLVADYNQRAAELEAARENFGALKYHVR